MDIATFSKLTVENMAKAKGGTQDALDPATTTLIQQLLPQVVACIQQIFAARQARLAAQKPTAVQKISLNMHLRREMGGAAFRENGREVAAGMIATAAADTFTDDDMQ